MPFWAILALSTLSHKWTVQFGELKFGETSYINLYLSKLLLEMGSKKKVGTLVPSEWSANDVYRKVAAYIAAVCVGICHDVTAPLMPRAPTAPLHSICTLHLDTYTTEYRDHHTPRAPLPSASICT